MINSIQKRMSFTNNINTGHGTKLDVTLNRNQARRQSELDIYEATIDIDFKRRILLSQPEMNSFESGRFDSNAYKSAIGMNEDDELLKKSEIEVIEASNQLANTSIVGIISINRTGEIIYSNSKAREIFQYPSLTGASIHDFVPDSFGGSNFKKKHKLLVESFFDRPFGGGRMLDPGIILRAQLKSGKLIPLNIGLEAKLNPETRRPVAVLGYIIEAGAVIDQSKVEKMLSRATLIVLQQFISQAIFSVISFVESYELEPLRYSDTESTESLQLDKCLHYSYDQLSGESEGEDYKMMIYVISTAVTIAISVLPLYVNHLHDQGEDARENVSSLWLRKEFLRYTANQINDLQEYLSTIALFRMKDVVTVAVVATIINLILLYKINTVPGEFGIDSLKECEASIEYEIDLTLWMSIVGIIPTLYLCYKAISWLFGKCCHCCISFDHEEQTFKYSWCCSLAHFKNARESEIDTVHQIMLHRLISKISANSAQEWTYLNFLHNLSPPVTTMQQLICHFDRLNETERHEFIYTHFMNSTSTSQNHYAHENDIYKFEYFESELIKAHRGFLYRKMKNEKLKKEYAKSHDDSISGYKDLKGSRSCPFSANYTGTESKELMFEEGRTSSGQRNDQYSINDDGREENNNGNVYKKMSKEHRTMSIDIDMGSAKPKRKGHSKPHEKTHKSAVKTSGLPGGTYSLSESIAESIDASSMDSDEKLPKQIPPKRHFVSQNSRRCSKSFVSPTTVSLPVSLSDIVLQTQLHNPKSMKGATELLLLKNKTGGLQGVREGPSLPSSTKSSTSTVAGAYVFTPPKVGLLKEELSISKEGSMEGSKPIGPKSRVPLKTSISGLSDSGTIGSKF